MNLEMFSPVRRTSDEERETVIWLQNLQAELKTLRIRVDIVNGHPHYFSLEHPLLRCDFGNKIPLNVSKCLKWLCSKAMFVDKENGLSGVDFIVDGKYSFYTFFGGNYTLKSRSKLPNADVIREDLKFCKDDKNSNRIKGKDTTFTYEERLMYVKSKLDSFSRHTSLTQEQISNEFSPEQSFLETFLNLIQCSRLLSLHNNPEVVNLANIIYGKIRLFREDKTQWKEIVRNSKCLINLFQQTYETKLKKLESSPSQ
jgi:hypothetical protein